MMHQIFNQDGFLSRNRLPRHAFEGMTGLAMTIAGTGAFLLVLFRIMPVDLFSTALWYDNLNINKVWSADASEFFITLGNSANARTISHEALAMSLFLALTQILLAIMFAASGGWLKNETESSSSMITVFQRAFTNTPGYGWRDLNWQKINYLTFLVCLILFDTLTDTIWKTTGTGFDEFLRNFALSFVVNNIFSEWGLFIGLALAFSGLTLLMHSNFIRQFAESFVDVAVALFEAVWAIISKLFGALFGPIRDARRTGSAQSNNRNTSNRQQQGQSSSNRNSGSSNRRQQQTSSSARGGGGNNQQRAVSPPIILTDDDEDRQSGYNTMRDLINRSLRD